MTHTITAKLDDLELQVTLSDEQHAKLKTGQPVELKFWDAPRLSMEDE